MAGPEAEIERTVCKEAERAGWLVRKLRFVGTNGAPDRIFGKGRRCVVIEFKAPGESPTRQQAKRHVELREDFGWDVYWTDNANQARRMLGLREQ